MFLVLIKVCLPLRTHKGCRLHSLIRSTPREGESAGTSAPCFICLKFFHTDSTSWYARPLKDYTPLSAIDKVKETSSSYITVTVTEESTLLTLKGIKTHTSHPPDSSCALYNCGHAYSTALHLCRPNKDALLPPHLKPVRFRQHFFEVKAKFNMKII